MQYFVRIIEFLKHHLTKGDETAASWVNPYCSGICSYTSSTYSVPNQQGVLILIVVEYALIQRAEQKAEYFEKVLILIVVEYALIQLIPLENE